MKRLLLPVIAFASLAARVEAWPAETMTAMARDARRLLPASLGRLLAEREPQQARQSARVADPLARALAQDLPAGTLRSETLALLDAEVADVVALLREGRVSDGLARLGGLLRVTADLSDPVLAAAPGDWPPGLAREYYALFAANVDRMPVVLEDPKALQLSPRQLGALWQAIASRSREQAPTIRAELLRDGKVVSHTSLDFRSPAWAVASLAYSRAVTGTAAAWLAVWRESRGDTTRMRQPPERTPHEPSPPGSGALAAGAAADRRPHPEAP